MRISISINSTCIIQSDTCEVYATVLYMLLFERAGMRIVNCEEKITQQTHSVKTPNMHHHPSAPARQYPNRNPNSMTQA